MKIMLIKQTLESEIESEKDDRTVLKELKRRPFGVDPGLTEKERWALFAEQQSRSRGKYARDMLARLDCADSTDRPGLGHEEEELDISDILSALHSLGMDDSMLSRPLHTLSGGWKMRVQLAKALLYQPDLLLLDEPTNHLDISGIAWLQRTLQEDFADMTVLLVSHVRSFLNGVVQDTILFRNRTLEYFRGNYDHYLQCQEEKAAFAERMQDSIDRKKAHLEASIQLNVALALVPAPPPPQNVFGFSLKLDLQDCCFSPMQ